LQLWDIRPPATLEVVNSTVVGSAASVCEMCESIGAKPAIRLQRERDLDLAKAVRSFATSLRISEESTLEAKPFALMTPWSQALG